MLPPKPIRRRHAPLRMMREDVSVWYWMARFIRAQIRVENVWRSQRGIPFCHMPISVAEYLTEPIDRGRNESTD